MTSFENPGTKLDTIDALIEIKHLTKYFPVRASMWSKPTYVKAVDDVSLIIRQGETLGLVGESGCGKTTLGRCVVRLYKPQAGELLYHDGMDLTENLPRMRIHIKHYKSVDGASNGSIIDLAKLPNKDMSPFRRDIQMIFQDPYSSLNPRMTVLEIIAEPIRSNHLAAGDDVIDWVKDLMEIVGLDIRHLRRYPHAFSGGQRQRIGIARALATNPRLIVADEPVSALDVSIQAQILNLMQDLQNEFGLTYLFVAHNLSVVEHISDRVAVMYVGRLVELAPTEELFAAPLHPYTEALLSSIPKSAPDDVRVRIKLEGEIPNPVNPPAGCYFHPRCRYAQDVCRFETPAWREVWPAHFVACPAAEQLDLIGVNHATR